LEQAIADYTEAIRVDPSYADAYYNRGAAYEKLGQTADAEADYAVHRQLKSARK
jgi:Flp pilus assembly protein TadD